MRKETYLSAIEKIEGDPLSFLFSSHAEKRERQLSKFRVAVEHVNAADGAKAEPVCSFFGCADLVCEADKDLPQRMHFCQKHRDQLQGYVERHEVPKILGFWVKANGGAKRLAETF